MSIISENQFNADYKTAEKFEEFILNSHEVIIDRKAYMKGKNGTNTVLVPLSLIQNRTRSIYQHALSSKAAPSDIAQAMTIIRRILQIKSKRMRLKLMLRFRLMLLRKRLTWIGHKNSINLQGRIRIQENEICVL